jgi:Na+/melibiose symporter-like transporter
MVDRFAEADNVYGGFIFTAIVMLVVAMMDFICLCLMKNREPVPAEEQTSVPFGKILKSIFASRGFRSVVIAYVLWTVANYTISGFMGTYKTKDLLLTVGTVQLINIVGCLARALVSRPFGRYTDKRSYSAGLKLGLCIVTLSFVANIFTTPSLWWMVIVHTLLHNVAMAGIGQNFNNIMFSYVEESYFVEATAIKNSIGGLCGFLASLVAGEILSAIQENGNMLFGMPMYAQQLLSVLAAVIALGSILYIHFVLQKQKVVGR